MNFQNMLAMFERGSSIPEISEHFGIGFYVVLRLFKKNGIPMRSRLEANRLAVERGRVRPRRQETHPNWKGGRKIHGGYIEVYLPNHPRAMISDYVLEHILVLEEKLGRSLLPNEVSHHKDENKQNND